MKNCKHVFSIWRIVDPVFFCRKINTIRNGFWTPRIILRMCTYFFNFSILTVSKRIIFSKWFFKLYFSFGWKPKTSEEHPSNIGHFEFLHFISFEINSTLNSTYLGQFKYTLSLSEPSRFSGSLNLWSGRISTCPVPTRTIWFWSKRKNRVSKIACIIVTTISRFLPR